MGSYFSTEATENNESFVKEFDYNSLEDYSISELIEFINKIEIKKLDVGDDFGKKIKNIDFESMSLIPMSIEFYEKLKKVLPEYVPDKTSFTSRRYIKPRFSKQDAEDNFVKKVKPTTNLSLDLGNIDEPKVLYNNNNITIVEYIEAFNKVGNNTDMTGISKKILQLCHSYHKTRILNCYNKLYRLETNPNTISFGKTSFIYKESKKGPKDSVDSFRKIMAVPNVVSHFHRIIALRLAEYLEKNNYIDTNIQKGAIPGIKFGVLEQVYKVKEVVKEANQQKKQACVMFLDISDAFGSIKLDKLCEIMEKYHIHNDFIDYIKAYYSNFMFYAKTKEWSTKIIKFEKGILQGCPLSPVLFVLAMNYLLKYIDDKYKKDSGYQFEQGVSILLTAFIDDICIVTKDLESMKEIYFKLKAFLEILGLQFNTSKSALIHINKPEGTEDLDIDGIKSVKSYKYLGEYLSNDGTITESYMEFIKELGRKLFALDKKKIDNETKFKFFSKCLLPWVQRKMLVMYDLNRKQRINIVSLIKRYITTWGNNEELQIFTFVSTIFEDTKDEVIKKIDFSQKYVDTMEDIEIANNVMKKGNSNNLNITYDNVNKSPVIPVTKGEKDQILIVDA